MSGVADLARPRVLHVERRGVRVRAEGRQDADRLRRRRAGAQGRGRAGARAGVADRADADAGPDRQAARAAVRRQGPLPARGQGDLVARRPEGHGDRRRVHRRARTGRSGRPHQGDRRRRDRPGARADRAAAAVDRELRGVRRRLGAGRLDQHGDRQVRGGGDRRPEGASQAAGQHAVQADSCVHGLDRRGRTTRSRPTCRRRPGAGSRATSASPRSATR